MRRYYVLVGNKDNRANLREAHPDRRHALFNPDDPQLRLIKADVHDERSVADALADAYGAVNAVSLYVEQERETFHSVHVESAQQVATQAQRVGVKRLIHSGTCVRCGGHHRVIPNSESAIENPPPPQAMFGPDDAFLTTILKLLDRLPVYPMFGNGVTKLQPAYVEDVAEAIVRALQRTDMHANTFEFGGPRVYSYKELLKAVAGEASLKPRLIPIPFAAWHALAWFAEILPRPPISRNQVELMQVDTVASQEMPGFGELGITPVAVEEILREILWDH